MPEWIKEMDTTYKCKHDLHQKRLETRGTVARSGASQRHGTLCGVCESVVLTGAGAAAWRAVLGPPGTHPCGQRTDPEVAPGWTACLPCRQSGSGHTGCGLGSEAASGNPPEGLGQVGRCTAEVPTPREVKG